MQDRPDKATLMDAVAEFLTEEVRPYIDDRALSFRVLIAANLAGIVAREIRTGEANDAAQLLRLRRLLPDVDIRAVVQDEKGGKKAALEMLNSELTVRLRAGQFDERQREQVWGHVTETLKEKLAVLNPRFDTSTRIES